jgi:Ca2+-binding RTX toxin-like protein
MRPSWQSEGDMANFIGTNINDLWSGDGADDTAFGGGGDDFLRGFGGTDMLDGGIGNDTVDGGDGNDILYADVGNDSLTGGAGADSFRFAAGFGNDVITDFEVGVDRITLAGHSSGDALFIQSGANALIILPDGSSLTLLNTDVSEAYPDIVFGS